MSNANINQASPVNWAHPLNRGLVAWWQILPGVSSGTRLTDIVTPGLSGHHGTLVNMDNSDWAASTRSGGWGALNYASTNHVTVPHRDNLNILGPITVGAWCYPDGVDSGFQRIVEKQWESSLYFGTRSFNYAFSMDADGSTSNILDAGALVDKTWQYVMGVYDGSQYLLYIFGLEVGQKTRSVAVTGTTQQIAIGANAATGGEGWSGLIDDVAIWNRGLSPAEALWVYQLSLQGHPGRLNRTGRARVVAAAEAAGIEILRRRIEGY